MLRVQLERRVVGQFPPLLGIARIHYDDEPVDLSIVRRAKATPVHELERYMRCKDCSEVRRYPYKRSTLVALRPTKISASDPPTTWWPGER